MNYPKLQIAKREASPDTIYEEDIVETELPQIHVKDGDKLVAFRRGEGQFKNKAFYLSKDFNYTIGYDNENCLVLVVTKKS